MEESHIHTQRSTREKKSKKHLKFFCLKDL